MTKCLVTLILGVLVGALTGCGGAHPPDRAAIDPKALVERGAKIVDVRTPEEFASGHLQGATNIPVQEITTRISEVVTNKDEPVLVHCRSGRRSATAKAQLEAAGYTNVVDLGSLANARSVTGR